MQKSFFVQLIVILFGLFASGSPVKAVSNETVIIPHLTGQNFESSIKHGAWFIKFMAPWCPHCQHLAPIWQKVADNSDELTKTKDFHIAIVDCTTQGDLCVAHEIYGYPTLKLYYDGKYKEMSQSRDYEELLSFVKEKAEEYAALKAPVSSPEPTQSISNSNPNGQNIHLSSAEFMREVYEQPDRHWFIKMYAPWCGHCKKLAPVWEQLGKAMKDQIWIGEVDCTTDKDICVKFAVKGYPALKYFAQGATADYKGPRTLPDLMDFAKRARSPLITITAKDLPDLENRNDVFFVYVYDDSTDNTLSTIETAARQHFTQIPFYITKDPEAAKYLKLDHIPSAAIVKDSTVVKAPFRRYDFDDRLLLKSWVRRERFPLLTPLGSETSEDLLGGQNKLIVLGIIDSSKAGAESQKSELREVARTFNDRYTLKEGIPPGHSHGGPRNSNGKTVFFSWIDGVRWANYVKRTYGIEQAHIPAVIILEPSVDLFYPKNADGKPLSFSNKEDLIEAIVEAQNGRLSSVSTLDFGARIAKNILKGQEALFQFVVDHWLITTVAVLVSLWLLIRYLRASLSEDGIEVKPGHKD